MLLVKTQKYILIMLLLGFIFITNVYSDQISNEAVIKLVEKEYTKDVDKGRFRGAYVSNKNEKKELYVELNGDQLVKNFPDFSGLNEDMASKALSFTFFTVMGIQLDRVAQYANRGNGFHNTNLILYKNNKKTTMIGTTLDNYRLYKSNKLSIVEWQNSFQTKNLAE